MCAHSLGLKPDDFSAYLPERARSNAYSRPRLEFKRRAVAWASAVVDRLDAIGVPMQVHASDDHPSVWNNHNVDKQWIFFSRDEQARQDIDSLIEQSRSFADRVNDPSPHQRHAFLALRIDESHVEVSTQVHPRAWVDFETLRARLSDPALAEALLQQIQALPEQFTIGIAGQQLRGCSDATAESLLSLLEQAKQQNEAIWIGWSVAKDIAVENTALLDEQLQDALVALAPVYAQLSWHENDDPASMGARIQQMREQRQLSERERAETETKNREQKALARQQVQDESRKRTMERVQYAPPRRGVSLDNLFSTPPRSKTQKPSVVQKSTASSQQPEMAQRQERQAAPQRRESRKAPRTPDSTHRSKRAAAQPTFRNADGDIRTGSQVRVQAGPFAGKIGTVKQVDSKGQARVMLGLLATRISVGNLQLVTEQPKASRTTLQSSHRNVPNPRGKGPREN